MYVFKIQLRDFFDKTEISLFQFLMGENASDFFDWASNKSTCAKVFKLLADCEYVCILLDGLDEAKFNPQNDSSCFEEEVKLRSRSIAFCQHQLSLAIV